MEYAEAKVAIEEGEKLPIPDEPPVLGNNYCFAEWCIDSAFGEPYDFDQPVTSHLELHARYEYKAFVTFVVVYGPYITDIVDTKYVAFDSLLTPIDDNTWFLKYTVEDDQEIITDPFDFNTPINEEYITLYRPYRDNS